MKSEKLLVVRTNPPHIHKSNLFYYPFEKFLIKNLGIFAFFNFCVNFFFWFAKTFFFFFYFFCHQNFTKHVKSWNLGGILTDKIG